MRSSTPNIVSSQRTTKKSPIRRQRVRTTPAKKPSHFQQQIQKHQHKMVAILLSTLSLATFLAIVSYSPYDATLTMLSFRDVWKLLLGDPQLQALVETTHNWLGIVGANLGILDLAAEHSVKTSFLYWHYPQRCSADRYNVWRTESGNCCTVTGVERICW